MNPEAVGRRKTLTRFLCQELLYEYVSGSLAPSRAKDVAEYLPSCHTSQRELENLMKGLEYTRELALLEVSVELHEALLNFEAPWKKRLRQITLWSSQRGWKMLPYLTIGVIAVLALAVFKPWQTKVNPDEVLAEQLRREPELLPPLPPVAGPVPEATTSKTATEAPSPVAVPGIPAVESKVAVEKAPVVSRGMLSRGDLVVGDFNNTWPLIKEKIISLGGKAAGSVELGWLRRPDQSYFHFSIPESNGKELELFLSTFGPVRFTPERSPRVMPAGQIRFILTIKDKMINEGPPETP